MSLQISEAELFEIVGRLYVENLALQRELASRPIPSETKGSPETPPPRHENGP